MSVAPTGPVRRGFRTDHEKVFVKLWVTLLFFAWSGPVASALFRKAGLTAIDQTNLGSFEKTGIGYQAFWPEMLGGWGLSLLCGGALLLAW